MNVGVLAQLLLLLGDPLREHVFARTLLTDH